jgi:GAF domain-containing protein
MIRNFAPQPELLGIAPLVVPLIAAGTSIGSLIAGAVVAKRQQRRGAQATAASEANAIKLAELEARRQKLADEKKLQTTTMAIGIPAALAAAMFLMGE